jgi:hypothetical protein
MSERENTDANCGEVERVAETQEDHRLYKRLLATAPADMPGLVGELERLHNDARGCEFDLVPADGPVARLTLFMHENGDRILSALSRTPAVTDEAVERIEQIISAWAFAHNIDGAARNDLFKRLRALATLSHPVPGEQEPQSSTAIVDGPRGPEFGEALAKDGPTQ